MKREEKEGAGAVGGVSMDAIAAACGVSRSTVSRALSRHPRIPEATRERIVLVAEEMGYRPDAKLRELMEQVRSGRREGYQGEIALIFLSGKPRELKGWNQIREYVAGIRERADQYGYGVSEIWIQKEKLGGRTLSRMLKSRGIRAALLIKPARVDWRLDADWDTCAWVAVGFAPHEPLLHTVTPDWASDAREAVRYLVGRGHKRIGFVYSKDSDPLTGNAWLGGYAAQMMVSGMEPLVLADQNTDFQELLPWVDRVKPDALVAHSQYVCDLLKGAPSLPEVVLVNLTADQVQNTGLITSCRETGINAVDMVVGQLRRNERGIPSFQKTMRTKGRWMGARLSDEDVASTL